MKPNRLLLPYSANRVLWCMRADVEGISHHFAPRVNAQQRKRATQPDPTTADPDGSGTTPTSHQDLLSGLGI
jgi:hypothetical protein